MASLPRRNGTIYLREEGIRMGLFWDLMQQSQISDQRSRATSLEERVQYLENELARTQKTLHTLVAVLEKEYGKDIDGDGRVG
jgi:hypothetical protein